MKAYAYLRCSGLGQVDGDTWDRQRESIGQYAKSHNCVIEREFQEVGISGKLAEDDRPAFQEMVAAILSNGCRTVIVERLDRLAREYAIQQQLLTYLASKGIEVISADTQENVTAALMGDPMKRALVQIQGIFAELDKNMLVVKLRKARQRRRTSGQRCEGRKPYGELAGENAVLSLMVSNRDIGPLKLANLLNEQGLPTRYGAKWHPATVSKILRRAHLSPNP